MEDVYIISTCHHPFNRKVHLDRHRFSHSENKSFECSHCPKAFRAPKAIHEHIRTVHKPKTKLCDFDGCGKKFSTIHAIHVHQRKCHSKKFLCEWLGCEHSYTTKIRLRWHMNMHKGLKQALPIGVVGGYYPPTPSLEPQTPPPPLAASEASRHFFRVFSRLIMIRNWI